LTPASRAVLLAALGGAIAAGAWAARSPADPDFLRIHAAGALAARGDAARLYEGPPPPAGPEGEAAGRRPFRAPPAAAVLAAPLGALPERGAWILWEAACGALAAAAVALAAAAAAPGGARGARLAAAAAIPAAPLLLEAVGRGSMTVPLLALAAGSLAALGRGRDRIAGLLAGTAAALAVVPVVLVLWFPWKRRPRAAAFGLGAAAGLFLLLPLLAAGPAGGTGLLRRWAAQEDPLVTEIDERPGTAATGGAANVEGQSLKGILYRVLGGVAWFPLRERSLEGGAAGDPGRITVAVADPLRPGTVFAIWLGASFLLLAAAVFATGPLEGEEPAAAQARLPLEGGLVLAAIPLVWPEARAIHHVLCIPALAALAAALAAELRSGRRPGPGGPLALRAAVAAAGAVLLFLPASGIPGRDLSGWMTAWGAPGWGGLLLFAASALTLWRLRAAAPGMGPGPPPVPAP
jgi:glycosyl transferase family 87